MCKRTLILLAATLMVMGCAHGVKPMPAPPVPNVQVSAPLRVQPDQALPQPDSGKRSALLANHVAVAKAYHALAIDYGALVCTVMGWQGITVNGATPVRPVWCHDYDARDEPTEANAKR